MPQFDFATWPGQIAWLLIVFATLYLVMSRTLLPRVRGTLETRQGRIDGDMAEARRLRDEAQTQAAAVHAQMGEARVRAQRTAAEAKARSAAQAAARQAALEAELAVKLAQAEGRIRAGRDQAMGQVQGIAAETASAMAEKLSGRPTGAGEVGRALVATPSGPA